LIPQILNAHEYKTMKPKTQTLTLNTKDKLYVIGFAAGFTCIGFDVCQERSIAMAKWLGVEEPSPSIWGTVDGYNRHRELVELCRVRFEKTKEKCPSELTPQLIGLEGKTVEVVDKFDEKRKFTVGTSTGWIPCHIEIKRKNSTGGHAVMGAPFKSIRVV